MNKKRSVRIPVTDQMLKELRRKAQEEDIDVSNATRILWRDWIGGKVRIGSMVWRIEKPGTEAV